MWWLLAGALLPPTAGAPADRPAPVATPARCGDLLGQARLRPPRLSLISCRQDAQGQGKPFSATYLLSGRDAATVERFLMRRVGLRRLRRSCCQWDAPPAFFHDARGCDYQLVMVSDETAVSRRADWPRIARFAVVVKRFTEAI